MTVLPQVVEHLRMWRGMALVQLPVVGASVPVLYAMLLLNTLTQYACIVGVFKMTGAAGSLAMTLTISLRKFVSLLLSIVFFRNPFTPRHWLATVLVFGGTLVYSLWPRPAQTKTAASPEHASELPQTSKRD